MSANGDAAKQIWGTEFGVPTGGAGGVSEKAQAEIITRAYSLWRTYEWAGPLFVYQPRDTGADASSALSNFGLVRHDLSHKPAYAAYRALASGSVDAGTETCGPMESPQAPEEVEEAGDSTATAITVKRKAGPRGRGRVVGTVSARSAPGLARPAVRGRVGLMLYRRFRGGWRRVAPARTATLRAAGAFRRRLRTFRHRRLTPGKYRLRARYRGSPGAAASTGWSRKFRLRTQSRRR